MAAPLPTGAQISVLPVAPAVDPRLMVPDPQAALATAQAGLMLGQELADIGRKKAERELRLSQIKAEQAKAAYDLKALQHAEVNLPTMVARDVQTALAATEQARVLQQQQQALLNQPGLFSTQAAGQAQAATNALAQARADEALAARGSPAMAEAAAAAQTRGQQRGALEGQLAGVEAIAKTPGMPEGAAAQKLTSIVAKATGVTDPENEDVVDPNTGATIRRRVRRNPDGSIFTASEPFMVQLPSGAKSASAIAKESAELKQLSEVASALDRAMADFEKSGNASKLQAAATLWASTPPTGLFSLAKRFVGQWVQEEPTKEIVAQAQSFRNAVANGLFGSSLTENEIRSLDNAIPNVADIANPDAFRAKLKATQEFFDSKLRSAQRQGITDPVGRPVSPSIPASPFMPSAAAAPGKPSFEQLRTMSAPRGTVQQLNDGRVYRMDLRNGQLGWVKVQ